MLTVQCPPDSTGAPLVTGSSYSPTGHCHMPPQCRRESEGGWRFSRKAGRVLSLAMACYRSSSCGCWPAAFASPRPPAPQVHLLTDDAPCTAPGLAPPGVSVAAAAGAAGRRFARCTPHPTLHPNTCSSTSSLSSLCSGSHALLFAPTSQCGFCGPHLGGRVQRQ